MVTVTLKLELCDLGLELGASPPALVLDLLLFLASGVKVALVLHSIQFRPVRGRALLLVDLEPKLLLVPLEGPDLLVVLCCDARVLCFDARALRLQLSELPPEPLLLLVQPLPFPRHLCHPLLELRVGLPHLGLGHAEGVFHILCLAGQRLGLHPEGVVLPLQGSDLLGTADRNVGTKHPGERDGGGGGKEGEREG